MSDLLDKNDKEVITKKPSSKVPHNSDTAVDLEKHPRAAEAAVAITHHASSGRGRLIAGVATVVLLIGVGLAVWYLLTGSGSSNGQDDKNGEVSSAITPQEEHVAASFAGIDGERAVATTVTSLGGQMEDGTLVYDFAPYKVGDASVKSLPAMGDGTAVRVADAAAAKSALVAAHELFTAKGKMTRVSTNVKDAGGLQSQNKSVVSEYAIYRSDEAVCSLAYLTGSGQHVVSSGCAATTEYAKSATSVKPFIDAYTKANPSANRATLVFSAPTIADGQNGAKRATLYQSTQGKEGTNGVYLYSQSTSTAPWRAVGGPYRDTIPCRVVATNEQKAAFAGSVCYDEALRKERTV